MATTLLAREPERSAAASPSTPRRPASNPVKRVAAAAYGAFSEFLTREMAIVVLCFVVLYKFCDAFAGTMTAPFVIDLGFTRTDYANIVKGLGPRRHADRRLRRRLRRARLSACDLRCGSARSCRLASNLVFVWQAHVGLNHWALAVSITLENFTSAIGTVIFVAYLSALCQSPLHTATQYALLTALAAVGRTYLSSGAGFIAEATGWAWFFALSAVAAVPSLALLWWLQVRGHFETLVPARVTHRDD